jgi:hypothetical protein
VARAYLAVETAASLGRKYEHALGHYNQKVTETARVLLRFGYVSVFCGLPVARRRKVHFCSLYFLSNVVRKVIIKYFLDDLLELLFSQ